MESQCWELRKHRKCAPSPQTKQKPQSQNSNTPPTKTGNKAGKNSEPSLQGPQSLFILGIAVYLRMAYQPLYLQAIENKS